MIQIKADAAIKAAFNKAISVMGADVEWCEIFVIIITVLYCRGREGHLYSVL